MRRRANWLAIDQIGHRQSIGDNSSCQYSSFINFGCTYEDAINFNEFANVDDGSCEYTYGDTNKDGTVNIFDIIEIVNIILDMF